MHPPTMRIGTRTSAPTIHGHFFLFGFDGGKYVGMFVGCCECGFGGYW